MGLPLNNDMLEEVRKNPAHTIEEEADRREGKGRRSC